MPGRIDGIVGIPAAAPARLRRSAVLAEWAKCVTGQPWKEAYVFFKHDETENGGSGPPAVSTFVAACG